MRPTLRQPCRAGIRFVSFPSSPLIGGVSGRSAKLIFRYSADQAPFISTAPVTFTTSSSMIYQVTMSLDKTSYVSGENATLSISALDASGLSTSVLVNKLLFPFTTVTFIRGKAAGWATDRILRLKT